MSSDRTSSIEIVGDFPAVHSTHVLALHDDAGRITHFQHLVAFEGATAVTESEATTRAAAYAQVLGLDARSLNPLWVPEFDPVGRSWRVDVRKGALVEAEPEDLRQQRGRNL